MLIVDFLTHMPSYCQSRKGRRKMNILPQHLSSHLHSHLLHISLLVWIGIFGFASLSSYLPFKSVSLRECEKSEIMLFVQEEEIFALMLLKFMQKEWKRPTLSLFGFIVCFSFNPKCECEAHNSQFHRRSLSLFFSVHHSIRILGYWRATDLHRNVNIFVLD